jgi:hypothetical protein
MPRSLLLLVGAFLLLGPSAFAEEPKSRDADWPRWRGPKGDGVAEGRSLPVRWSRTENVRWAVALPGWGTSSPVVYGDSSPPGTSRVVSKNLRCWRRSGRQTCLHPDKPGGGQERLTRPIPAVV